MNFIYYIIYVIVLMWHEKWHFRGFDREQGLFPRIFLHIWCTEPTHPKRSDGLGCTRSPATKPTVWSRQSQSQTDHPEWRVTISGTNELTEPRSTLPERIPGISCLCQASMFLFSSAFLLFLKRLFSFVPLSLSLTNFYLKPYNTTFPSAARQG